MRGILGWAAVAILALSAGLTAGEAVVPEQAAKDAAAKLVDGGRVARCILRATRAGEQVYALVMVDDNYRYSIVLGAEKGELIRFERANIESTRIPAGREDKAAEAKTTFAEARKIALDKAGAGEVVRVLKTVRRDGKTLYRVTVMAEDKWHRVDIDAVSGEVILASERNYRAGRDASDGQGRREGRRPRGRDAK